MPSTDFQIGYNSHIRNQARLGRMISLITQDENIVLNFYFLPKP
jgi:hypothetical protein